MVKCARGASSVYLQTASRIDIVSCAQGTFCILFRHRCCHRVYWCSCEDSAFVRTGFSKILDAVRAAFGNVWTRANGCVTTWGYALYMITPHTERRFRENGFKRVPQFFVGWKECTCLVRDSKHTEDGSCRAFPTQKFKPWCWYHVDSHSASAPFIRLQQCAQSLSVYCSCTKYALSTRRE